MSIELETALPQATLKVAGAAGDPATQGMVR